MNLWILVFFIVFDLKKNLRGEKEKFEGEFEEKRREKMEKEVMGLVGFEPTTNRL